jgi:hypothetical protein
MRDIFEGVENILSEKEMNELFQEKPVLVAIGIKRRGENGFTIKTIQDELHGLPEERLCSIGPVLPGLPRQTETGDSDRNRLPLPEK